MVLTALESAAFDEATQTPLGVEANYSDNPQTAQRVKGYVDKLVVACRDDLLAIDTYTVFGKRQLFPIVKGEGDEGKAALHRVKLKSGEIIGQVEGWEDSRLGTGVPFTRGQMRRFIADLKGQYGPGQVGQVWPDREVVSLNENSPYSRV
ncbi:MAG TPA: hypothetical protein VLE91_04660 [Candidatus Saccharimonadales bacterium]|nr:hypothetical protein [Candidatus Saccharimonadales bacterium]